MPTMNVSLPAEFIDFVEGAVASGEYGSASDVVRESLGLLRREKAVRDAVAVGIEQARTGQLSKRSIAEIAAAVRGEEPLS